VSILLFGTLAHDKICIIFHQDIIHFYICMYIIQSSHFFIIVLVFVGFVIDINNHQRSSSLSAYYSSWQGF